MKDFDKIIQNVFIKLDPKIADLNSKEKTKLIDGIAASNGRQYLSVDFDFSHTGRKINRRIYSKVGHMMVPRSLVTPYPKPITLNHEDGVQSIIGRFKNASYVDMMDEARAYFKRRRLNESGLNQIDEALTKLDYEKAADAFYRTKVLNDPGWKGIGKISATARITDMDAIIKFLDQRYLNFSAEQDTDVYICSICMSDWKTNGMCDHYPGQTYDGKTAFMMTGHMVGSASSVVMNPADVDSIVTNLSFTDEEENPIEIFNKLTDNVILDSNINIKNNEEENNMKELLIKLFAKEELADKFIVYETIAKELNSDFKTLDKETYETLPNVCFVGIFPINDKEHADLAQKALETYKTYGVILEDESVIKSFEDKILLVNTVSEHKEETPKENSLVKLLTLDKEQWIEQVWNLVKDKASEFGLLVDSTKDEELSSLKTSLTQKDEELNNSKLEIGKLQDKVKIISVDFNELMKDHINIAKEINKKIKENSNLLDKVKPFVSIFKTDVDLSDKNSENILNLLDSLDMESIKSKMNDGLNKTIVNQVTDPTVHSTQTVEKDTKFSEYEKKVLAKFKTIKDNEGLKAAEKYFLQEKKYCKKDFNPTVLVEN